MHTFGCVLLFNQVVRFRLPQECWQVSIPCARVTLPLLSSQFLCAALVCQAPSFFAISSEGSTREQVVSYKLIACPMATFNSTSPPGKHVPPSMFLRWLSSQIGTHIAQPGGECNLPATLQPSEGDTSTAPSGGKLRI
jgi:hypothetical protein